MDCFFGDALVSGADFCVKCFRSQVQTNGYAPKGVGVEASLQNTLTYLNGKNL